MLIQPKVVVQLIAEMNKLISLPPHLRVFEFETRLVELFSGEQIDGSFRLNDD
uniref:Uncharacterized protein n=1 Tax=Enterobacter roggenkampii TaxID=1812935 RepID=A0A7G8AFY4_9ENTR|nr:hypothetical protein [Enterobacter roggenkampii]